MGDKGAEEIPCRVADYLRGCFPSHLCALGVHSGQSCRAQGPGQPSQEADQEPNQVLVEAARVDDQPILMEEVEYRVRQALGTRGVTDQARALLQAEALEQLIAQQKVLVQLQRRGEACTEQELDVEWKRLEENLQRQEKTLDDHCRALALSRLSLRRLLQWKLSWQRCRDRYATDENLQRFFQRHQRDFDGTTLRVAQILLKAGPDADRQALRRRAEQIRQQITSGTLSFDEAARQFSEAPTSQSGGELGWIARREPMPEFFSQAAFALQEGQLSQPVESPFGVHLIRCLELKPGQKNWPDVREAVREAALEYLFQWLAQRPQPKHNVQYTGRCPHFQPGTRSLVPAT